MAALRLVAVGAGLVLATAARAGPVDRWAAPIHEASRRFAIPETWIRSVIRAESDGETMWRGRPIESSAGAMGLMQLMPGTWRGLRAVHGLGIDPFEPRDNILAGTAYLRAMYDRFGYPGMFAAYNAGPARNSEHLATGRRLPPETRAYVAKIAPPVSDPGPKPADPLRRPAPPSLFALRRVTIVGASGSQIGASAVPSIFVTLDGKM
jgi:soluble lytic murein transglycosylase-like protein